MQRIIPVAFRRIRTAEATKAFAVDGLLDVIVGLRFMRLIIFCNNIRIFVKLLPDDIFKKSQKIVKIAKIHTGCPNKL